MRNSSKIFYLCFFVIVGTFYGCASYYSKSNNLNFGAISGCVSNTYGQIDELFQNKGNVVIRSTNIGISTTLNERFFIKNIPPGTYDIIFQHVYYKNSIIFNVRIAPDSVSLIEFRPTIVYLDVEPIHIKWEQTENNMIKLEKYFAADTNNTYGCKP